MVFRAEGAADLREFLRGGRVPSDVYLLRKMQAEDPDLGPVILEVPAPRTAPPVEVPAPPSSPPPARGSQELPLLSAAPAPAAPSAPAQTDPGPPAAPLAEERPRPAGRTSAELLSNFEGPSPPCTRAAEEVSRLFEWMLEHDPVVPNNLPRLEAIHTAVFQDRPVGRLTYAEHILLQVADDLVLHPTREALDEHLVFLARGYRRGAEAYHAASQEGRGTDEALWQMASMASRLRLEAWMYRSRYEASPLVAGRAGRHARHPRDRRKGRRGGE